MDLYTVKVALVSSYISVGTVLFLLALVTRHKGHEEVNWWFILVVPPMWFIFLPIVLVAMERSSKETDDV